MSNTIVLNGFKDALYEDGAVKNEFSEKRIAQIEALCKRLNTLSIEENWVIEWTAKSQARSIKQNKLMWKYNSVVSNERGCTQKFQHGENKLQILLPYMFELDTLRSRAQAISQVLEKVVDYEIKVFVAYDMVRTKDLTAVQMTEYLSRLFREFSSKGIRLEQESEAT